MSKNVDAELHKIGLYLINVNITDITDESNYIKNIGRKAAAEANNKALIDVANSDREGAIGGGAANRDRQIEVARNEAASARVRSRRGRPPCVYPTTGSTSGGR